METPQLPTPCGQCQSGNFSRTQAMAVVLRRITISLLRRTSILVLVLLFVCPVVGMSEPRDIEASVKIIGECARHFQPAILNIPATRVEAATDQITPIREGQVCRVRVRLRNSRSQKGIRGVRVALHVVLQGPGNKINASKRTNVGGTVELQFLWTQRQCGYYIHLKRIFVRLQTFEESSVDCRAV